MNGCHMHETCHAPPPPVSVVAQKVKSGNVPIYLRGVGTVIAFNNVIIRSQITGQLVKIDNARP